LATGGRIGLGQKTSGYPREAEEKEPLFSPKKIDIRQGGGKKGSY